MAFCPYCGKPVNDGEVCSCQAAPAPQPVSQAAAPQYAPQAAPQPVSQAAAPQAAPQYAPQPQAAPQYAPQPQAAPQAAAPQYAPQPQTAPQAAAPQYAPQPQTAPQAAAPQYAPQAAPQAAAPQYAPQPQAAPQAAAPQYAPQPQAAPQYAQQPQQYVPAQPAGPNAFNDFIGVFPKAVINPTETAEGVGKKVKISHAIIWGGVFAFSVFLMFILFYIRHLSAGKTFLLAFMNALTYSMIIAASAAFIMGVSRNKEAGYPRVLGAICIETIPISCLALFVGLWGLLIYSSISFFSSIFAILFAMGIERTFRYFASGLSRTKQFLLSAAVVGIICSIQYMMIDLFLYKLIW